MNFTEKMHTEMAAGRTVDLSSLQEPRKGAELLRVFRSHREGGGRGLHVTTYDGVLRVKRPS
mgnify:CR=1 FL=1